MENAIANVNEITFDIEMELEDQKYAMPLLFPKKDKGDVKICRYFSLPTGCKRKELCSFRHTRNDGTMVCKHWLKGLCKKGEGCEFLHRYNLGKVPECFFFSKYKMCNKENCNFQHSNREEKIKECAWYNRGFCRNGPYCKGRHVKKTLCRNYLTGFCSLGPKCKNGHPRHNLPVPSETQNKKKPDTTTVFKCSFCGNNGHVVSHCFKMKNATNISIVPQNAASNNIQFKTLAEVTCFKCGEKGHYANKCTGRVKILVQPQNM